MNKRLVGLILLMVTLASPGFAFAPWLDSWNKGSYYSTNAEQANFNAFLGRSEIRAGINLTDKLPALPSFSPYVVALGVASQDKNYWNNDLATGYGIRVMPFENFTGTGWADEWIKDVKVYGEVLTIDFLKDRAAAAANNVPLTEKRIGFDLYHEWNQKEINKNLPWSEAWSNFTFRSTNFYQGGYKTYLFSHEQKTGIYLENESVKPYLRTNLYLSGRPESWWNYSLVGPGIQVDPFRDQDNPLLKNFNVYLEMLSIIWYKEKDARPASDLRFGVEYRLYLK